MVRPFLERITNPRLSVVRKKLQRWIAVRLCSVELFHVENLAYGKEIIRAEFDGLCSTKVQLHVKFYKLSRNNFFRLGALRYFSIILPQVGRQSGGS